MERIIITHLSGSKENQVEEFPLKHIKELSIGRDVASTIKYEPDADDLVSRQHARIAQDPQDETKFIITDLNSTNGTYLNKQRISSSAVITPGDVVQLGPSGPEFEFDIEPHPKDFQGKTRADPGMKFGDTRATRETQEKISRPPGRKTFEFVIGQIKGDTRKYLINGAAALLLIVALVAGIFIYQGVRSKQKMEEKIADIAENQPMSAATIAQKFGSATVFIEGSWKLISVRTGEQLYPLQIRFCDQEDKKEKCLHAMKLPVYLLCNNNTVEPFLVNQSNVLVLKEELTPSEKIELENELKNLKPPESKRHIAFAFEAQHEPIGSKDTGSGFLISQDGFILTSRHVAAPWETQIDWKNQINLPLLPSILIVCEDKGCNVRRYKLLSSKMPTSFGNKLCGKNITGRHEYFNVTFPKTKSRIPARLVRASDTTDVALIKIDVQEPAEKVNLNEDNNVNSGDAITVMGYPGMSPIVGVRVRSLEPMHSESEMRQIPEPTVTNGIIGKVIRGEMIPAGGSIDDYFSEMGDVYQLTINTSTKGNSGGPVFDNRGRVIGIFTYARRTGEGQDITFAVPIKHALDIMGTQRVLK